MPTSGHPQRTGFLILMPTQLDAILATTRAAVAKAKERVPASELERRAAERRPRGWAAALRRKSAAGAAVIAEIKKASPSRGLIRADFDVAWLAQRYSAGGTWNSRQKRLTCLACARTSWWTSIRSLRRALTGRMPSC
jgi:hypothetical protein